MADQSFMIPPASSPDAIKLKRALAQALVAKGTDTSPIQSPWQGVARVSQALLGGYQNAMADQEDKARQAQIMSIMGGGASSPATTPPVALDGSGAPAGGMTLPAAASGPATAPAAPATAAAGDGEDVKPKTYSATPGNPDTTWSGKAPSMAMAGMGAPGQYGTVNVAALPDTNAAAAAIGKIESSNRYDALGPQMGNGDRAYGRYQVMGSNIPQWTKEVLGQSLTPQEFLANQKAQDAVFMSKFGQAAQKYGNLDDAASVWFSGRPMAKAGVASDGFNTVPEYVAKFRAALGAPQGNMALPAAAAAPAAPVKPFVPSAADGSFWGSSYEDDSPQAAVGKALNPTMAFNGSTSPGSMSPLPPGIAPPQAAPAKAPDSASAAQNFVRQQTAAAQSQGQTLLSQAQSMRQRATALMAMGETGSANLLMQQAVQTETAARNALGTRWSTTPAGKVIGIKPDGTMNTVDLSEANEKLPTSAQEYEYAKEHPEYAAWLQSGKGGADGGKVLHRGDQLIINGKVVAENKGEGDPLSNQELIDSLARRDALGDTTWSVGLGRGAQSGELLAKVRERSGYFAKHPEELDNAPEKAILEARADQAGRMAGARTGGSLNAKIDVFANEASNAADLALKASRNLPRSSWVPLNQIVQMGQAAAGNPQLAEMKAAATTFSNTYSKAIAGGGAGALADREHAMGLLMAADSPQAFEATVNQLKREVDVAHRAARSAKALGKQELGDEAPSEAGAAPPGSQPQGVLDYLFGRKPAPAAPAGAPTGARQAPDGNFYVPDPKRPGKWLRVDA